MTRTSQREGKQEGLLGIFDLFLQSCKNTPVPDVFLIDSCFLQITLSNPQYAKSTDLKNKIGNPSIPSPPSITLIPNLPTPSNIKLSLLPLPLLLLHLQ